MILKKKAVYRFCYLPELAHVLSSGTLGIRRTFAAAMPNFTMSTSHRIIRFYYKYVNEQLDC